MYQTTRLTQMKYTCIQSSSECPFYLRDKILNDLFRYITIHCLAISGELCFKHMANLKIDSQLELNSTRETHKQNHARGKTKI